MKLFIYTHSTENKGTLVEKAMMDKPNKPFNVSSANYEYHLAALLTYSAQGFSESDNGKEFREDQFEVKLQISSPESSAWSDVGEEQFALHYPAYRRIIAVPIANQKRSEAAEDEAVLNDAKVDALVIDWFEKWCEKTKRGGGVLITTSIKEMSVDFYKSHMRSEERMFTLKEVDWLLSKFICEYAPHHSAIESPGMYINRNLEELITLK